MAGTKDIYTNDEANALFPDLKAGEVGVKKVTRYMLVRYEPAKMVFPDGRTLGHSFHEVDLGEFRRKDEAEKAAAALNDVRDETTMDGRPAHYARARIGGRTYKYGYISEGLTQAEIDAKDADIKRMLLEAIQGA